MTVDEVLEYYGSKRKAADAVDVTYEAFRQWYLAGVIPRGRQFEYEVITDGELVADDFGRPCGSSGKHSCPGS